MARTGAASASTALDNLFSADTGGTATLNVARLAANSIPGGDLQSGTVTSTQLNSLVTPGNYNNITVDASGRVTGGNKPHNRRHQPNIRRRQQFGYDQFFVRISDRISAASLKTNSLPTGWLGLNTTSPQQMLDVNSGNIILIEGPAGALNRQLEYATTVTGTPITRWSVMTNSTAESGNSTGSDFVIQNYNDVGTAISSSTPALTIMRASGNAAFLGSVTAPGFIATGVPGFTGDGSGLTGIPASSITGTIGGNVALGSSASIANPARVGEGNTGLFSPASGAVAVSSLGTEIMRVDGTGVGINTLSILNAPRCQWRRGLLVPMPA